MCPLNNDLRQAVAAQWAIRTHANLVARAVVNDCWVIAADVCGAQAGHAYLIASVAARQRHQTTASKRHSRPPDVIG